MEMLKKIFQPPWLAPLLGVPALACLIALRQTGMDENMLFDHSNLLILPLWLLTAAMGVLVVLGVRPLSGKLRYHRLFPASNVGALGILAGAVAMAVGGWAALSQNLSLIDTVVGVLGLVSGGVMVYLAWCRFRGIPHSFLLWAVVTVFLMLRLMVSYRDWSAQPDLLHYFFPLMASVSMTVASYHRTACTVGLGSRRMYLGCTQIGAFCALVTLGAGFDPFYGGLLLWALLDQCSQRPGKERREKPVEAAQ